MPRIVRNTCDQHKRLIKPAKNFSILHIHAARTRPYTYGTQVVDRKEKSTKCLHLAGWPNSPFP
jgi:hypothetical protein